MFPRLNDDWSPSETANVALAVPPASSPPPAPPLPLYVEPVIGEEALLSWIFRLARAFGVSLQTLISEAFGIEDGNAERQWWRYPHPSLLARIAERTGVPITEVRRMTFDGLGPVYRDDEARDRFTGRWFLSRPARGHAQYYGVCGLCLEGDREPGVRTLWSIGWMALCPRHGIRLLIRCPLCRARPRFPPFEVPAAFSPSACCRCRKSLLSGNYRLAHPAAAGMQAVLLRAKRQGFADFSGLGRLTWKETITLIDVLLGMVWTDTTPAARRQIFRRFSSAAAGIKNATEADLRQNRHHSLCFLAWLLNGWPHSDGAQTARNLLERWHLDICSPTAHDLRPRRFGPRTDQSGAIEGQPRSRLIELTRYSLATF